MPKKGKQRIAKFQTKYDLDAIMLRWKALKDFSIKKFYLPSEQHYTIDENVKHLIKTYILPYGDAGSYMDLVRKIVYDWSMLTDQQKEALKQQWIKKGLPLELFDKIVDKYMEISALRIIPYPKNWSLTYEVEVSPLPKEAVFPSEEDYTSTVETETEIKPVKPFAWWRQEKTTYHSVFISATFWSYSIKPLIAFCNFEVEILPSWLLAISLTAYETLAATSFNLQISLSYETVLN